LFDDLKFLGFIFDLSIAHLPDGRRIIDVVKTPVAELVQSLEYNELAYFFQPDSMEVPKGLQALGQTSGGIANFRPCEFNLSDAIKHTVFLAGQEDPDYHKYIFILSDRYTSDKESLCERAFKTINKYNIECEFIICPLGKCDSSIENLCEKNVKLLELDLNSIKEDLKIWQN